MGSMFEGKRVFISGPMTGMPDWNRAAFADAECMLRKAGAREVYNPAADSPLGEDSHTHEHWMLRTLHHLTMLVYCYSDDGNNTPHWDMLLLLPGWEDSRGARVERDVAAACGIELVYVDLSGGALNPAAVPYDDDEPSRCPWCGEPPQRLGGGRVAHACRVLDMELRTSAAAWNSRAFDRARPECAPDEIGRRLSALEAAVHGIGEVV